MFLKEFNQRPAEKIKKINKLLKEQFNLSVESTFPAKAKLEKLKEQAEQSIIALRGSHKKFHLEADYARFLGIKDVVDAMLQEGMYAESPRYMEMKDMINASVQELMDTGYTMDEACSEAMNRYRRDERFAYDDEHVQPIIIKAAKDYYEACSSKHKAVEDAVMEVNTDLNEYLLSELAKECGVELKSTADYEAIEEKLASFAEVTGKSRDAVVGFLNGLEENAVVSGIRMFGRKVAETNKFVQARRDAIRHGKKEFEVGGEKFPVTGDTELEENVNILDELVADLLNEAVDVEQAEVVMAVRGLADDLQDHIERVGRMVNEDVPAIADQMRGEMGVDAAAQFSQQATQILNQHLEATRSAKEGMDGVVATMSGESPMGGMDNMDLGGDLDGMDGAGLGGLEDELGVDNIDAAAGPEDNPLGRAKI